MTGINITVEGGKAFLGGYDAYIPSDPIQSAVEIERFRYILIAMYSVFAWEHLVTLHEEIARWKQLFIHKRVVPVNVMVLLGRYLVWANVSISGTFFFGSPSPSSCQGLFSAIFVTYALIYLNSAFIFVMRLRALYQDSKRVRVLCYLAFGVVAALWIASLGGFYSDALPENLRRKHLPICIPAPSPKWRVMGFAASAFMDLFILVLTVAKTRKAVKELGGSTPHQFITETAIVAAAITFVVNSANTISDATQNNVIIQAYAVPIAVVVLPITTFRVVFHSEMLGFKSSLLQMSGERGADGQAAVTLRQGSVQLKGLRSRQGSFSNSAETTGLPFTHFNMSADSSPKVSQSGKLTWSNSPSPALGNDPRRGSATPGSGSSVTEQDYIEETINVEEGRMAPAFTNPFAKDVVMITRETVRREG